MSTFKDIYYSSIRLILKYKTQNIMHKLLEYFGTSTEEGIVLNIPTLNRLPMCIINIFGHELRYSITVVYVYSFSMVYDVWL